MSTETSIATVDVAEQIRQIRGARLCHQRIQAEADRLARPGYGRDWSAGGKTGETLRRKLAALRASAAETRDKGRPVLAALRRVEAEARGVPLAEVDEWVPEPAAAENDEYDEQTQENQR